MEPHQPSIPATQLVRIAVTAGRVSVVAEDRPDVLVDGDAEIERSGEQTTISGTKGSLVVHLPAGTNVVIGSEGGRVEVSGRVGHTSISSSSGRVTVEHGASVDIRSETGKIVVGHCEGACCLRSGSGSIAVASCANADVATETGKVSLAGVRGVVHAHCTSGRIDIEMAVAEDVHAETVTGRITVALPTGTRPFRTDSPGQVQRPSGTDCTVVARSVTGRVDVLSR